MNNNHHSSLLKKSQTMPAILRSSILFPSLLAGGLISLHAEADETEPLRWRGFMTTAVTWTDGKDEYPGGIERMPNYTDLSKVALNLSKDLDHDWNVAAQFIGANHGAAPVQVDWAFASWRPSEHLSLRIGHLKLPTWLLSDYPDVGRYYPWVRPPIEIYQLNPIRSFSGSGVTFTALQRGDFAVTADFTAGGIKSTYTEADAKIASRNIRLASLQASSEWLTVRAAHTRATVHVTTPVFEIKELSVTSTTAGLKAEALGILVHAEYAVSESVVPQGEKDAAMAEAARAAGKAAQTGDTADQAAAAAAGAKAYTITRPIVDARAWYGSVAYQLGPYLPYVMVAEIDAAADSPQWGDQRSITGGVKFDLDPTWDLKAEVQRVTPLRGTQGMFVLKSAEDVGRKYAPANIFAVALDVVF